MNVAVQRAGTAAAGYEVATAPLPAHLRPFLASWLGYREWNPGAVPRLEYPTGRAVLIFELGDPIEIGPAGGAASRYRAGFFAGIDDAPSLTVFTGAQAGLQLNLTPRGAHALAGRPLRELARQVVGAGELALRASLAEELAEAPDWAARFAIVTRALERRLVDAAPPCDVVTWALGRIDARRGAVRIDELAAELGFSRKHLHERFLRDVGLPPKRYAEVRRFDHVLERLRAGGVPSFARLAAELGYADQSHLARDVRRFSSLSATALATALRDPIGLAIEALTSSLDEERPEASRS